MNEANQSLMSVPVTVENSGRGNTKYVNSVNPDP